MPALANAREQPRMVMLSAYSRDALDALRAATGIDYDALERGILHYYTDARSSIAWRRGAADGGASGCNMEVKSAADCVASSPRSPISARASPGRPSRKDD